jgi:tRNA-specific 2-thiouridylase
VVAIRPATREVVVGTVGELERRSLELEELNWLDEPLRLGDRCEVQVRHRAAAVPAEITAVGGDGASLRLLEPARAVAPGQSGVLYRGELVLGGGIIAG